jgi:RNA polymerase sigma-70 factor (ECF subfamily)
MFPDKETRSSDLPMERLLAEARLGSSTALGRLFELARLQLLLACRRELPSGIRAKVGASDIVQETAAEAYRDLHRFNGRSAGEFFAWLRSILRNNLTDAVRRYGVVQARSIDREQSLDAADSQTSRIMTLMPMAEIRPPDGSVIRREDAAMITLALARLPEDYQIVLRLRYWDGLTFEQIGERIGRTGEAVRKLWYRAVRLLQAELLRQHSQSSAMQQTESPRDHVV